VCVCGCCLGLSHEPYITFTRQFAIQQSDNGKRGKNLNQSPNVADNRNQTAIGVSLSKEQRQQQRQHATCQAAAFCGIRAGNLHLIVKDRLNTKST